MSTAVALSGQPLNLLTDAFAAQTARNGNLLAESQYLGSRVESRVADFNIDIRQKTAATEQFTITDKQVDTLHALGIEAARISIRTLESLARIKELDHLGGGLELIGPLLLSMAVSEFNRDGIHFTVEHGHTSVGYYSCLAAYEYVAPQDVIDGFRRGLTFSGHVAFLPGGSEIMTGRLGVGFAAGTGEALGLRAENPQGAWQIVHCGDAGWYSGQAKNGMGFAAKHKAPVTFVMHRNGIQLSGRCSDITVADPRKAAEAEGLKVIETRSLHDYYTLSMAYREAYLLAQNGQPSLIYPTGIGGEGLGKRTTLQMFAEMYGVQDEVLSFATQHAVPLQTPIWVPGSLMSYRDTIPMLQCLFLVNNLPGGEGHHDGHMKGRTSKDVLKGSMFQPTPRQAAALAELRSKPRVSRVTEARPERGSPNLLVSAEDRAAVKLPQPGESASPRAGSERAYELIARTHPNSMHILGCDLDVSTKLAAAAKLLPKDHVYECAVAEQGAAIMANGLSIGLKKPHMVVVSTFTAFWEAIAREGLAMSTYTRNLTGENSGFNAVYHFSHTGSQTGRDHFPGWSLDWLNVITSYLPHLDRAYTPSDANSAFVAVMDAASRYGGHIVAIPRDNLPVLTKSDGSPLWQPQDAWEPVTAYRQYPGAQTAILSIGAPSYLAAEAAEQANALGIPVDAHIVNGLPISTAQLGGLISRYPKGIVTVEDGNIGTPFTGVRGLAAIAVSAAASAGVRVRPIGITDPTVAPSEGPEKVWAHFGITKADIVSQVVDLARP